MLFWKLKHFFTILLVFKLLKSSKTYSTFYFKASEFKLIIKKKKMLDLKKQSLFYLASLDNLIN